MMDMKFKSSMSQLRIRVDAALAKLRAGDTKLAQMYLERAKTLLNGINANLAEEFRENES